MDSTGLRSTVDLVPLSGTWNAVVRQSTTMFSSAIQIGEFARSMKFVSSSKGSANPQRFGTLGDQRRVSVTPIALELFQTHPRHSPQAIRQPDHVTVPSSSGTEDKVHAAAGLVGRSARCGRRCAWGNSLHRSSCPRRLTGLSSGRQRPNTKCSLYVHMRRQPQDPGMMTCSPTHPSSSVLNSRQSTRGELYEAVTAPSGSVRRDGILSSVETQLA
jgi:hypothetical protein